MGDLLGFSARLLDFLKGISRLFTILQDLLGVLRSRASGSLRISRLHKIRWLQQSSSVFLRTFDEIYREGGREGGGKGGVWSFFLPMTSLLRDPLGNLEDTESIRWSLVVIFCWPMETRVGCHLCDYFKREMYQWKWNVKRKEPRGRSPTATVLRCKKCQKASVVVNLRRPSYQP